MPAEDDGPVDPSAASYRPAHAVVVEPESSDASAAAPKVTGLRKWLPAAIMAVVLVLAVYLIAKNFSGLKTAVSDVGLVGIIFSFVLAVAGTITTGLVWISVLRGLGAEVGTGEAAQVFFVSQLGKYVPGSVWPVIAQMAFGKRSGTPRRTMLAANLLLLAIVAATGLLTGAVLLPWSSPGGLHKYWWAFILAVPLLVSLHPRVVPAVLDKAFSLAHQPKLGLRVSNRGMAQACAWGFLTWVLLGAHLLVMTHALGASGGDAVAAAIGGMGLAFAVGLIAIPVPAGAGVRDAVLVATFTVEVGHTKALAVALASRVLLVLADVGMAGVAAASGRRLRRLAAAPAQTTPPVEPELR